MGKVIDTAGQTIADTSVLTLHAPDILGPAPAPLAEPESAIEPPRSSSPFLTAVVLGLGIVTIAGIGLLYAQNARMQGRVEARLAREAELDQRVEALTPKLDALGAKVDAMASRVQAMSNKVEGLGSQVSSGLKDANRSLTETMSTNMNALSKRLADQQQQQQKDREKEERQQLAPPSSNSPYSTAPGAIRPRRVYPSY